MGRATKRRSLRLLLLAAAAAAASLVAACHRQSAAPVATSAPSPAPVATSAPAASHGAPTPAPRAAEPGPVPIYPEDARRGSDAAPVTLVAILDLQCPFCAHVQPTLAALRGHYGPEKLRFVVKHNPLPFHEHAKRAALKAIAVQRAGGDEAFFRFIETVFARQQELSEEALAKWAEEIVPGARLPSGGLTVDEQLARDMDFARLAGANGTPAFFINGIRVSGAQPLEEFQVRIDGELKAIDEARRSGKPAGYPERAAVNFTPSEAGPQTKVAAEDDRKTWKVPVGSSPALGPADALVTIVEFGDYQCPFCRRVQKTLEEVRTRYGNDVRIVYKHNPLPSHAYAMPAAELAVEAYREQGALGFWAMTRTLYEAPAERFSDQGLLAIAMDRKLDPAKARRALEKKPHESEILADMELALSFGALGTPAFFINGRRLRGAQPFEKFAELIDGQLVTAREMVGRGVAKSKVYETILATAEGPPPPEVVDVSAVMPDRVSRGPARAPVVVYEFSDFQCPFCKRVQPTIDAFRKEFGGKVRLVWVNLPLAFHQRARAAANAALEVRARGGDAAFWKMHDLLFESQPELSDDRLADLAERVGVDGKKVLAAVHSGTYDAIIDEDLAAAEQAHIRGTPGFSINGYFISGAQRLEIFRRTLRRALDDKRRGVVPKPNYEGPAARPAPPVPKPHVSAHHVLVQYRGALRAAATVTRTKEEARALAAQLRQELLRGADFEKLARARSDDASARSNGGSLGSFGPDMMVKPFSEAAFALKPGEVSDVVETQFGFHVIRRDE